MTGLQLAIGFLVSNLLCFYAGYALGNVRLPEKPEAE